MAISDACSKTDTPVFEVEWAMKSVSPFMLGVRYEYVTPVGAVGGSDRRCFMISGVSAICGTHFGLFRVSLGPPLNGGRKGIKYLTKLPASMCVKPAELNFSKSSILVLVGTTPFSFWSPSRAPTSTIFTTPECLDKGWSTVILCVYFSVVLFVVVRVVLVVVVGEEVVEVVAVVLNPLDAGLRCEGAWE